MRDAEYLVDVLLHPGQLGFYSQYGQDVFVERYFKGKRSGFFVEVGAYDGSHFSNTKRLEETGWQGIAVEGNPSSFAKLRQSRRCFCEGVCAGKREGVVNFTSIEGDASMLSGISENYHARHRERIVKEVRTNNDKVTEVQVAVVPLSKILSKYGQSRVDYLSVDTEGNELDVLRGIDFQKALIGLISVETNYGTNREIQRFLLSEKYRRIGRVGPDTFFELQTE